MVKALALYSGGLDSILAILVMRQQNIPITAVTFVTGFGCYQTEHIRDIACMTAKNFGFELITCDITAKFLDIVRLPKFGYGKNMNPCLDCKILMLREAKKLMQQVGANFIVTGEVLSQRPMSQRRDTFPVLDRESGLAGFVLRPLSAQLLKPTEPETCGWVDRQRLYAFYGRSRKPQIALAQDFGLVDYPQPAGGCLLTDPIYARKLRQLLHEKPGATLQEISLLRIGRHFRMSSDVTVIIGRDHCDNAALDAKIPSDVPRLFVEGFGSPLSVVLGRFDAHVLQTAAALTARYSSARIHAKVTVTCMIGEDRSLLEVTPASEDLIERLRAYSH
jgi:hypothetical protein